MIGPVHHWVSFFICPWFYLTCEESLEDLLVGVEDGDVDSFVKLVRFVEDNYRKALYTMGYVELGDYVLIKSCTYILLSSDGMAYALVNGDKPEVISLEVHGGINEVIDEVCGPDEEE
ncbi:hypothetical protein [Vulcanisaeta sp. JCM 14467]|uniref:hypothetical protein n=1 Tax=Vulcanisaeta sp. JCM 14467 TaxID=1295370 RepID=UPI002092F162|nr:hypothetical protein [Vulcanisaeta sp. JCM 14467]